ncbi:MAG: MATE family efflux transporter [Rhodobacteraceae bacterium]|nr:MATE family efflux transporter [Paracoccaceae bacterium]
MAINASDVLMIARLGSEKLAASVLSFNMWMLLWFFGMGIIQAVIPLGAQARGRKEPRDFRRVVRMGLWMSALYCIPAWCVTAYTGPIFIFLGQDPAVSALAAEYMTALQWGLFPALAIMAIRGFLTVMGYTGVILTATLLGVVINVVLNYVLIFGHFGFPRLELVGAGIASVLASSMSLLFFIFYVLWERRLRRYTIFGRLWRPDVVYLIKILKMGLPIGVTLIAEAGLFAGSTILVGWLGTQQLAAHGVAVQIVSMTFMVPVGLSQASLTRVGYAAGRRNDDAVARAGWSALGVTLLIMLCFAVVFWTVPEFLVSLYLNPADPNAPEVLGYATSFLAVAAIFQLFDGGQIIGVNNLRGIGDAKVPLAFAIFGYWFIGFSLSLGLGFGLNWGGVGIWCGLAGGLAFVALATNIRFFLRRTLRHYTAYAF